jgi:hypothetical protein
VNGFGVAVSLVNGPVNPIVILCHLRSSPFNFPEGPKSYLPGTNFVVGIDVDTGFDVGLYVGTDEGACVGSPVGTNVGPDVGIGVGNSVGIKVGCSVGNVVGTDVGNNVGIRVVSIVFCVDTGIDVKTKVFPSVGFWVGLEVGEDVAIVGTVTGIGTWVGLRVGRDDGKFVGANVGTEVGRFMGNDEGICVAGICVGYWTGAGLRIPIGREVVIGNSVRIDIGAGVGTTGIAICICGADGAVVVDPFSSMTVNSTVVVFVIIPFRLIAVTVILWRPIVVSSEIGK